MSKPCNCFNEYLDKIKEKIIDDIMPENADPKTLEVAWDNSIFRFDGKPNNVMLKLNCEYQRTKKNGDLYRNRDKRPVSIGMAYCPFCGGRFNDE